MTKILLDTCAWLWLSEGNSCISKKVIKALPEIWLLSAISVWEVAVLVHKNRIALDRPLRNWVHTNLLEAPHIHLIPLEPDIAITSTQLANCSLKDPADRIVIATAIEYKVPILTGDNQIIDYAKKQYISFIKV